MVHLSAPPLLTPTNETWRDADILTWHGTELANTILLLVFGIIGNSLVLHIYIFRLPSSTVTLIKSTLAVLDLSAVVVTKTLRFYMLLNPNSHFYNDLCVFLVFFSTCNTFSADLVLVVIAVDRFLRICTVHKRGVRAEVAKKVFIAILICCGALDTPIFWLFGKGVIYVPEYGVKVTYCFFRIDQLRTTLFYIFCVICLFYFLATSLTLSILYFKIIRRLLQHTVVQDRLFASSRVPQSETKLRSSTREAMKNSIVTFAIITVMNFIISFMFLLTLSSYVFGGRKEPAMTPRGIAVHDLAKQAPMYIHIINPIIYSFTSSVFREEVRRLLLCQVCTSRFVRSFTERCFHHIKPESKGDAEAAARESQPFS